MINDFYFVKMMGSMPEKKSNCIEISAVSTKILLFCIGRHEMSFYQVEAQFFINMKETKFNYSIAQMELPYIENVWDIIRASMNN